MTQLSHPLRLGTRASPLALAQAEMVKSALCAAHHWPQEAVIIVAMTASGDLVLDRSLADLGGKALWTKELDRALIDRQIDFAVHSMKDVETIRPSEFAIVAMLPRADVRDRLVGAQSIETIPPGGTVGTNSPRRTAQLSSLRPDLHFSLFRGNVATRLAKIERQEADATLLAAAGLDRLGLPNVGIAISTEVMLPAPAQGAIGIEMLADNDNLRACLSTISDSKTMLAVLAERAFLAAIGGTCHSPVAAYAQELEGQLTLHAEIYLPDGSECQSGVRAILSDSDAASLAHSLLARASTSLRAMFAD